MSEERKIEEALRHCAKYNCEKCAYKTEEGDCEGKLMSDTIKYIMRLKDEVRIYE